MQKCFLGDLIIFCRFLPTLTNHHSTSNRCWEKPNTIATRWNVMRSRNCLWLKEIITTTQVSFNYIILILQEIFHKRTQNISTRRSLGKSNRRWNNNTKYLPDSYVETSQSYSTVVFHSKSKDRPKSAISENSDKYPQMRKTSMSTEMLSTGGKNGKADQNFNFVKEEIVPGRIKNILEVLKHQLKFLFLFFSGIVVEGDVFDL